MDTKLKKAAYWLILFLCAFIPVRNALELYISSLVKIIPDLLILALLVWYAVTVRFRFRFRLHDWLFLGFIAVGAVSSLLINHSGLMPLVFQVRSIGIYYLLYFVVRNLDFGKKEFSGMVTMLQVMALLLFVFAVIEKVCAKTVLFPQSVADNIIYPSNFTRTYSLFFNPNTFGLFLVFVGFLSLLRTVSFGIKTSPVIYGILFASLLMTMSRSAMIALAVGLIAIAGFMLVKKRGRLPYLKILISAAIIVVVGFAGYYGTRLGANLYYEHMLKGTDKDSALIGGSLGIDTVDRLDETFSELEIQQSGVNGRIYNVKTGIKIWKDHLIAGTGLGTYGSSASMNYKSALVDEYDLYFPLYADNEYIVVLVETGLLGALLFAAFLGAILFNFRKHYAKLLFCLLFGWFGMFYNIFEVQIGAMLFWTLLSMQQFPAIEANDQE